MDSRDSDTKTQTREETPCVYRREHRYEHAKGQVFSHLSQSTALSTATCYPCSPSRRRPATINHKSQTHVKLHIMYTSLSVPYMMINSTFMGTSLSALAAGTIQAVATWRLEGPISPPIIISVQCLTRTKTQQNGNTKQGNVCNSPKSTGLAGALASDCI